MKRITTVALLSLSLLGGVTFLGCDREVAHTSSTKVNDDTIKHKETTVREKADGSYEVQKTEQKKDLDTGVTKTETEIKKVPNVD